MTEKELTESEISKKIKKECKGLKGSKLGNCAVSVTRKLRREAINKGDK